MANVAALPVPLRRVGFLVVGSLLTCGLPAADTATAADETTKPPAIAPAEPKQARNVRRKASGSSIWL